MSYQYMLEVVGVIKINTPVRRCDFIQMMYLFRVHPNVLCYAYKKEHVYCNRTHKKELHVLFTLLYTLIDLCSLLSTETSESVSIAKLFKSRDIAAGLVSVVSDQLDSFCNIKLSFSSST